MAKNIYQRRGTTIAVHADSKKTDFNDEALRFWEDWVRSTWTNKYCQLWCNTMKALSFSERERCHFISSGKNDRCSNKTVNDGYFCRRHQTFSDSHNSRVPLPCWWCKHNYQMRLRGICFECEPGLKQFHNEHCEAIRGKDKEPSYGKWLEDFLELQAVVDHVGEEFDIKVEDDEAWVPRGSNKRPREVPKEDETFGSNKRGKRDVDRRMGVRKGGGKVVPVGPQE